MSTVYHRLMLHILIHCDKLIQRGWNLIREMEIVHHKKEPDPLSQGPNLIANL